MHRSTECIRGVGCEASKLLSGLASVLPPAVTVNQDPQAAGTYQPHSPQNCRFNGFPLSVRLSIHVF